MPRRGAPSNNPNLHKQHFKKGESGNPNGRPLGAKNITTTLREMIEVAFSGDDQIIPDKIRNKLNLDPTKKYTLKELMIIRQINQAITADNPEKAFQGIADRLDGKAHQTIQLDQTSEVHFTVNNPYDPTKDPEITPQPQKKSRKKKE